MRERKIKELGEVFTPSDLVNTMLDELPDNVWIENSTFLEPSCGDGSFVIEVIKRKVKHGHDILSVISSVFGVDIQADNIEECKKRVVNFATANGMEEETAMAVADNNFIIGNFLE